MLEKFIGWFEMEYPNFVINFGSVSRIYDKETNSFHIEEIQDAYEKFKKGEEIDRINFGWRKW